MPRPCLARLSVLILAAAFAGTAEAATLAEIKQRGYLVLGVSTENSPFGSIVDGKPAGFDSDLADRFGHFAGLEIRRQPLSPGTMDDALHAGTIDVAASSVEITPTRQTLADSSLPLAEATLYYMKRANDDQLRGLADLDGKPFGIRADPQEVARLTQLEHSLAKAGAKLGAPMRFDDTISALDALAAGRVAYLVADIVSLQAAIRVRPGAFALGQPVARTSYVGWAVTHADPDLTGLLADFLKQERSSGDLTALQSHWLGRAFPDLPASVSVRDWWASREDKPASLPIPSIKDPD